MFLTKKWQVKPSFPDIFIGWKINQVISPNKTMPTFPQAPGAFLMGGWLCTALQRTSMAELPGAEMAGRDVTSRDLLRNTHPQRIH